MPTYEKGKSARELCPTFDSGKGSKVTKSATNSRPVLDRTQSKKVSTMLLWVRSDIFDPSALTAATSNIQENLEDDRLSIMMSGTRTSEEDWKDALLLEKDGKKPSNRKAPTTTPSATVNLKFEYKKDSKTTQGKTTPVGEQMDCFINMVRTTRIQFAEGKRKDAGKPESDGDKPPVLEIPISSGKRPSIDTNTQRRKNMESLELETDSKKRAKEEKVGRFSNNMKDAVRTVCQVCKKDVEFNQMRIHTRRAHKLGISDYKQIYGNLRANLVEAVYHKCSLCSQVFLLNGDTIATHAKKHQITHKEYNSRFIVLKKEKLEVKEEEYVESKHEELMNELDDNLSKMKSEKSNGEELRRKLEQMSSDELLKELDLLIASC